MDKQMRSQVPGAFTHGTRLGKDTDSMRQADKRTLFVGGFDENVSPDILQGAFIPFGDIAHVELPMSDAKKCKGFAFVSFELEEDAMAAMENMDKSELFGRTIHVNVARPSQGGGSGGGGGSSGSVWADSDAYNAAKSSAMAAAQPTVRGADAKAQTPAEEPANKRQKM